MLHRSRADGEPLRPDRSEVWNLGCEAPFRVLGNSAVHSRYSERPVSAHLTHWLARRSASEAAHFGHSSGGREGRLREVLSSNR